MNSLDTREKYNFGIDLLCAVNPSLSDVLNKTINIPYNLKTNTINGYYDINMYEKPTRT